MKRVFFLYASFIITALGLGCSTNNEDYRDEVVVEPIPPIGKVDETQTSKPVPPEPNAPLGTRLDLREKVVVAVDNAVVYTDPAKNAKSDKKVSYFQILYSFGAKEVNGRTYVAVGESFQDRSRFGFIDEQDLVTWRHRVGFLPKYSPARANKILIYNSPEDLQKSLDGDNIDPIGEYVVTPDRPAPKQPWLICDKKKLKDASVAYKVYALGKTKSDVIKGSYSEEEITTLGSAIRTLDVVFLIDGTGSMSDAINNVKSGVSQIARAIQDFKEQDDVDVKFGLVVYRDVCDGAKKYEFNNLSDVNSFLEKISTIEATGGGDEPERGFLALQDALNKTSWRPSSVRHMLVVGDARWHVSGENNPSNVGVDQVVDIAKSVRVHIGVLAVEQDDLKVQLASLASRTDGEARLFEDVDVLAGDLKNKLQKNLEESKLGGQVFDRLAKGEAVKDVSKSLGTSTEKIYDVVRVLKTQGVDFERFKTRLDEGQTVVVNGWIRSDESSDDLEVYLRRFEATSIKAMLESFGHADGNCLDIYRKSSFLAFDSRVQDYNCDVKLLEDPKFLKVKEGSRFDYANSGLPFGKDSILRYTGGEFYEKNEKERSELLETCKKKLKTFDGYLNTSERWDKTSELETGWVPESAFP